jgi:hypothetical protein
VHLVGFIIKKFATMHGHMNVKCEAFLQCISPKSDNKRAEFKYKLIYASQYSMSFNVSLFMKVSLLMIRYNVPVLFQSPLHEFLLKFYCYYHAFFCYKGVCSGAISCGTVLQASGLRVQFPMVSLGFFIHTTLPTALWSWGRWCH